MNRRIFEDCVVIMPAFNEVSTIASVIRKAREVVPSIVVIDDCSTDETGKIAQAEGASVVRHDIRRGYDQALLTGYRHAYRQKFRWMVTLDADGQHDPESLSAVLQPLLGGEVQLVLGRRPKKARISESLFALYAKFRFGVSDPLCGLKAYCVDLYDQATLVHQYESIGSVLALELIHNRANFVEVPIPIFARRGRARIGGALKANWRILKALGNTIRRFH